MVCCVCVLIYLELDLTVNSIICWAFWERHSNEQHTVQQRVVYPQSPPYSIRNKYQHSFILSRLLGVCIHLFFSYSARREFLVSLRTGQCVHKYKHSFDIQCIPSGIPCWTSSECKRGFAFIVENFQPKSSSHSLRKCWFYNFWIILILHKYSGRFFWCVFVCISAFLFVCLFGASFDTSIFYTEYWNSTESSPFDMLKTNFRFIFLKKKFNTFEFWWITNFKWCICPSTKPLNLTPKAHTINRLLNFVSTCSRNSNLSSDSISENQSACISTSRRR